MPELFHHFVLIHTRRQMTWELPHQNKYRYKKIDIGQDSSACSTTGILVSCESNCELNGKAPFKLDLFNAGNGV